MNPMAVTTRTVWASEGDTRLDRWFHRHFPMLTQGALQKMLRTGQIRVDGKRAEAGTRLRGGQVVRIPPMPEGQAPKAEPKPVNEQDALALQRLVIYRDDSVIAIDKPQGLPVQGGPGIAKHVDGLLDALRFGSEDRPRLVHRLDRDTTGVLVLARTPAAAAKLAAAFRGRDAEKTYWAVVVGNPKPEQGVIELHLVKKGVGDRELVVPADPKEFGAEPAETEYVTISRAGHRAAWMALRPHTGRTHQLRAHMKAIGFPILGDPKYGDENSAPLSEGLKLLLHARRIELPHPSRGSLIIEAPMSPEMRAGFDRFGFDEHEAAADPFEPRGRRR